MSLYKKSLPRTPSQSVPVGLQPSNQSLCKILISKVNHRCCHRRLIFFALKKKKCIRSEMVLRIVLGPWPFGLFYEISDSFRKINLKRHNIRNNGGGDTPTRYTYCARKTYCAYCTSTFTGCDRYCSSLFYRIFTMTYKLY